ncbi:uncharacterized protein JCM10292_003398 [Rhodotorula paludigena]|uniref:uncharacterized protein n=1 Tax=Rhodotorula paludigena TaxID=86838 RepID=UPI00317B0DB1
MAPPTVADVDVLPAQPPLHSQHSSGSTSPNSEKRRDSDFDKSETSSIATSRAPLAPASEEGYTPGAALLHHLHIRRRKAHLELDAVATQESVYDGPLADHYKPAPEWENIEHFDPSLRWTHREERSVRRKIDFKILAFIMLMFLALNIHRTNLANATADHLLDDLGVTQADYNLAVTLGRVGFLLAEVPSQIIGKYLGVDIWLPICAVGYSVLGMAQFAMKGRVSFLCLRFFIAVFQGGFIPDAVLYLSYFYTRNELPVRLAVFWSVNATSSLLTAFLAVGLLKMRGVLGHAGWQWMFLIEGLVTLLIALLSFFVLPAGPSQTKTKLRPKGFFSDKEVKIIVNKIVRDDPAKAQMHNREPLTLKTIWAALKDYDMYPMYLIGLSFGIGSYPISSYFQLSMRDLGFSTVMANVLAVPHTFITIFNLIAVTCLSEIINNRTWLASLQNVWMLPFYIALVALPNPSPWTYFALATLLLGYPYAHAIQVAWTSRNSGSVRTRTISAAVYNMFVQLSGVIGANLYQANDRPRYVKANSGIIAVIAFNLIIVYPGTFFYYRARNAWKEKRWSAMSTEERSTYLTTTKDEGCRRLDFRFAY